jgi:Zn2+/Cd2+-exporting ATPase
MSARRLQGVIQFNISFSIAVKLVFLLLAIVGYTSLWLAIAADTSATLIVTANTVQLLRVEPPANKWKGAARI